MQIFDFHLHPGYDFHNDELGYEITPERFTAGLAAHGVCGCAGSAIHKADSNLPLEAYAQVIPRLNREALAFRSLCPSYVPGIHVHPAFPELSVAEIEHCAKDGARLVGELVPYLMAWKSYADPVLWEILRVAQQKNMLLSFHPNKHPEDMEPLLAALPHAPIVIAHLDGYGLYEFEIKMMRKYEHVYADISAHGAGREGMLEDAVRRVGADRILYGSDYPGYSPKPFIDRILSAKLTDDAREAILYGNAARLLEIS